jgi:hypothetical protein
MTNEERDIQRKSGNLQEVSQKSLHIYRSCRKTVHVKHYPVCAVYCAVPFNALGTSGGDIVEIRIDRLKICVKALGGRAFRQSHLFAPSNARARGR